MAGAMIMFMPLPTLDAQRSHYLRTPQGKVAELRLELNSGGKKDKNFSAKKTALKKIVANMTMSNNDMVALFPDIVGCMHIPSLEIKKMYVPRASTTSLPPLTAPGASCIWSTMPA
jgi:AP-2 complex subunit beta-1